MPEYRVDSLSGLENVPITGASGGLQILGGLGTFTRQHSSAIVSHYNIQPVFDIYATTQDRDLGGIASTCAASSPTRSRTCRAAPPSPCAARSPRWRPPSPALSLGLVAAILFIYLLIVVNFQSWLDPFVIITALPAALVGIVWMLFTTGTALSVPALTGAIMCMGVATANSILVVSFARERLEATGDATIAAHRGRHDALPPRPDDRARR